VTDTGKLVLNLWQKVKNNPEQEEIGMTVMVMVYCFI